MSSIKLTADSGGGTFELKAPASSSNTRSYTLPDVSSISTLGGIDEFDHWYLTASVTSDGDLTSNLLRNDRSGITPGERIGTGMTENSGIFTFPRTGKYVVFVQASFVINGSDSVALDTQVTTNNSAYSTHTRATDGANASGNRTGGSSSIAFIDVTDTTQVKVKFNVNSLGSGSSLTGNSSYITTGFVFMRIGDT